MSAVPVATRGYFCDDQPIGVVTRGYFCVGVVIEPPAPAPEELGGAQFRNPLIAFKPITDPLKTQIPVDAKVAEMVAESDTEFVIDGKAYTLVEKRTPSEIIAAAPEIDRILDEVSEKLGTSRRKARKELYNSIIEELKASEQLKQSIFNDDEEIIMILVATDDL